MKICINTENLDFWIFRRVLRPGRHPRGFPELVGSILYEYQPERSHMDLFRIHFHDFPPKSGILQSAQPVNLLYRDCKLLYMDHKVSVWHYHNSENPYHPSTATCLTKGTSVTCPEGLTPSRWARGQCFYLLPVLGAGNGPNGSGRPGGSFPRQK